MNELHMSLQNVIDGQGIGISVTGMFIVFSALVIISVIIAATPHVLKILDRFFPEKKTAVSLPQQKPSFDEMTVAAITAARHRTLTVMQA